MSDELNKPEEVTPEAPKLPEPAKIAVKLTEEDKEKFFKAFIADEPYVEEMSLFNGKVQVVFRTVNLEENEAVFTQIQLDQKNGVARNDDSYLVKIVEYRLAGCLVSVNDEPFCPEITPVSHPINKEAGTTYLTERVKEMQKKWHTFKLGAITDAFNKFEAKVRKLTEESFDPNF